MGPLNLLNARANPSSILPEHEDGSRGQAGFQKALTQMETKNPWDLDIIRSGNSNQK